MKISKQLENFFTSKKKLENIPDMQLLLRDVENAEGLLLSIKKEIKKLRIDFIDSLSKALRGNSDDIVLFSKRINKKFKSFNSAFSYVTEDDLASFTVDISYSIYDILTKHSQNSVMSVKDIKEAQKEPGLYRGYVSLILKMEFPKKTKKQSKNVRSIPAEIAHWNTNTLWTAEQLLSSSFNTKEMFDSIISSFDFNETRWNLLGTLMGFIAAKSEKHRVFNETFQKIQKDANDLFKQMAERTLLNPGLVGLIQSVLQDDKVSKWKNASDLMEYMNVWSGESLREEDQDYGCSKAPVNMQNVLNKLVDIAIAGIPQPNEWSAPFSEGIISKLKDTNSLEHKVLRNLVIDIISTSGLSTFAVSKHTSTTKNHAINNPTKIYDKDLRDTIINSYINLKPYLRKNEQEGIVNLDNYKIYDIHDVLYIDRANNPRFYLMVNYARPPKNKCGYSGAALNLVEDKDSMQNNRYYSIFNQQELEYAIDRTIYWGFTISDRELTKKDQQIAKEKRKAQLKFFSPKLLRALFSDNGRFTSFFVAFDIILMNVWEQASMNQAAQDIEDRKLNCSSEEDELEYLKLATVNHEQVSQKMLDNIISYVVDNSHKLINLVYAYKSYYTLHKTTNFKLENNSYDIKSFYTEQMDMINKKLQATLNQFYFILEKAKARFEDIDLTVQTKSMFDDNKHLEASMDPKYRDGFKTPQAFAKLLMVRNLLDHYFQDRKKRHLFLRVLEELETVFQFIESEVDCLINISETAGTRLDLLEAEARAKAEVEEFERHNSFDDYCDVITDNEDED